MFTYFLFIIGFVFLIKGADWLIKGASSLAKRLNVSTLVIGLTVVTLGTTMPELVVNILASWQGANDLAIGNILGSNICNIWLILGLAAIIFPLPIKRGTVFREIPFSFVAVLTLAILVNNFFKDGSDLILSRADGLILLIFLGVFIYYTFIIGKIEGERGEVIEEYKLRATIAMIWGGALTLGLGAKWIVDGAIQIAAGIGVSQAFVGLTIVALGTSLPELATAVTAAAKQKTDIVLGNLIGSTIFNIFWILGISSLIKPLHFSLNLNSDILVSMLAITVLFLFMFVGKRNILQRWQGGVMVGLYVLYIGYLILRG